ncbi:MAG: copper homeostasis protein CutC [Gemmatimonadaceae bacterium]
MTADAAKDHIIVEAAVETIDGALAAERAGADRLELCADLANGGTTPSLELIDAVRRATALPVQVMVRPRPGSFVYTDSDIARMTRDIELIGARKLSGIVTGAINADRQLDVPSVKRLIAAANTIPITFHRAFDRLASPVDVLDELVELGVSRLLTSGGALSASEGVDGLAALVERARRRIVILAGGGVRAHNVREIIARTGVREVHARFVDYAQMKDLVAAARD